MYVFAGTEKPSVGDDEKVEELKNEKYISISFLFHKNTLS